MFKITIKEISFKDHKGQHYQKLREPYPDEWKMNRIELEEKDPQYGYKQGIITQKEEHTILEQEVESMDVASVIKAINKL